jgi:hypothetical protein
MFSVSYHDDVQGLVPLKDMVLTLLRRGKDFAAAQLSTSPSRLHRRIRRGGRVTGGHVDAQLKVVVQPCAMPHLFVRLMPGRGRHESLHAPDFGAAFLYQILQQPDLFCPLLTNGCLSDHHFGCERNQPSRRKRASASRASCSCCRFSSAASCASAFSSSR